MIRILLADDHTLMREGVRQLFTLTEDIVVTAEAANGGEVLELLRHGEFDLALLDLKMPGLDGAELVARIKARAPQLPILILSMQDELHAIRRVLRMGASGYVTKDAEPQLLLDAVRKVAGGAQFVAPELAERLVFHTEVPSGPRPDARLSERELHVLRLWARGMSVSQIAAELSISGNTVSTHKARLMAKLNIENNAELLRYVLANGLAD